MMKFVKATIKRRKSAKLFLGLIIAFFCLISILNSQNLTKPYLAPAKDYTPQIYKYLFMQSNEGTQVKQDNSDSKQKKIQSVLNDSIPSISNNMEIRYLSNNLGEPDNLIVTVKEKDKKINITIYNLIGNKVSDVFNGVPGSIEREIEDFRKEIDKLSNGVYICVLQGHDYRLMRKFTISR